MSEFLIRGWNVAIPEVDIGDDIFVVQDDNGILRRVQVKTATAAVRKNSFSGQFKIPLTQLKNISSILVHYVFIIRCGNHWTKPVIIRQDYLLEHWQNDKVGSEHKDFLKLYFSFADNKVECSGYDFSKYVSDFSDFPLAEV